MFDAFSTTAFSTYFMTHTPLRWSHYKATAVAAALAAAQCGGGVGGGNDVSTAACHRPPYHEYENYVRGNTVTAENKNPTHKRASYYRNCATNDLGF